MAIVHGVITALRITMMVVGKRVGLKRMKMIDAQLRTANAMMDYLLLTKDQTNDDTVAD